MTPSVSDSHTHTLTKPPHVAESTTITLDLRLDLTPKAFACSACDKTSPGRRRRGGVFIKLPLLSAAQNQTLQN